MKLDLLLEGVFGLGGEVYAGLIRMENAFATVSEVTETSRTFSVAPFSFRQKFYRGQTLGPQTIAGRCSGSMVFQGQHPVGIYKIDLSCTGQITPGGSIANGKVAILAAATEAFWNFGLDCLSTGTCDFGAAGYPFDGVYLL